MSNVSMALEKLYISSSESMLSLCVASSLSFQCAEIGFDLTKITGLLDLLKSRKVWVCRGHGCSLNFSVLTTGQPLSQERRQSLVGGLGVYLRDDSLWSQLSLEALLNVPNRDDGGKHDFSLKINYAQRNAAENLPSIPVSPVYGDVRPPVGIPRFELQTVEITMNFKDPVNSMLTDCKGPLKIEEAMLLDHDHDPLMEEFDTFGNLTDTWVYSEPENEFESLLSEGSDLSDEQPLLYLTGSAATLLTPPTSTQTSNSSQKEDMDLKELSAENGTSKLDLKVARRMASLALHTLIRGRRPMNKHGIKVQQNQRLTVLSQIAPALWSPGFLEAMSHRSSFLTPIASSFSTSILRNAQTPSLRRKLLNLQALLPEESPNDQQGTQIELDTVRQDSMHLSKDINQAIQQNLWRKMQALLYDEKAVRKLKYNCAIDFNAATEDDDDRNSEIEISLDEVALEIFKEEEPGVRSTIFGLTDVDLDEFSEGGDEGSNDDEFEITFGEWASTGSLTEPENLRDEDVAANDAEFPDDMQEDERDLSVSGLTCRGRFADKTLPTSASNGHSLRAGIYVNVAVDEEEMLV